MSDSILYLEKGDPSSPWFHVAMRRHAIDPNVLWKLELDVSAGDYGFLTLFLLLTFISSRQVVSRLCLINQTSINGSGGAGLARFEKSQNRCAEIPDSRANANSKFARSAEKIPRAFEAKHLTSIFRKPRACDFNFGLLPHQKSRSVVLAESFKSDFRGRRSIVVIDSNFNFTHGFGRFEDALTLPA